MPGEGLRGSGGCGCGRELLDARRLGELQLAEDGALRSRDLGALTEGAGGTGEGAHLEALQIAAQVRPGLTAAGLGDADEEQGQPCLLYTSPSPRDGLLSRMPSSA